MSTKAFVITTQQDEGEGLMITDLQVFLAEEKAKEHAQVQIDEYAKDNPEEAKPELNQESDDAPFLYQAMNDDVTFMVLISSRDIQE